jgi:hypothetical protein
MNRFTNAIKFHLTPISKLLFVTFLGLLCLTMTSYVAAAPQNKEKGQQCSDGLDNDNDGLIDAADPDCGGGGGGGTTTEESVQFHVEVLTPGEFDANPWSPDPVTCAAYTGPGGTDFRVRFPRHMQCVPECWIFLDLIDGYLTDDISINLSTRKGQFTGFSINGQDTIGKEGIMHESDELPLDQPVPDNPELGFEIPIYSDVPIYQLSGHLSGRRVGLAGVIQLGKLIYTPCGGALACPETWPVEYPDCP